jgi:hypothetical protein
VPRGYHYNIRFKEGNIMKHKTFRAFIIVAVAVLTAFAFTLPASADSAVPFDTQLPVSISLVPATNSATTLKDWNYDMEFSKNFMSTPSQYITFRDGAELFLIYHDADCPNCEKRMKYMGPDGQWHDASSYADVQAWASAPMSGYDLQGYVLKGISEGLK